jgi:hypothetical protein
MEMDSMVRAMANPSPAIAQIHSKDDLFNRFQQNVVTGVTGLQNQLNNTPSGGIFLKSVHLQPGVNNITHNLGKVPTGFIITDIDAASTIYRISYSAAIVALNSSATAIVTLFLF